MASPRYLIDARKLGDGGIGIYIENLVDGLLEARVEDGSDFSLTLLTPPFNRCTPDTLEAFDRWGGDVRLVEERCAKYSARELLFLPLIRRQLLRTHDLYHAPHYTLPLGMRIPTVVTVHDTIHISQPERTFHRPAGRVLISSALARADRIITVSRFSAEQLRRHFPKIKKPVAIIPNSLRRGFAPDEIGAAALTPERGHLLFVGTGRPHKGFLEFLLMLDILRREPPAVSRELRCVVIGDRYQRYSELINRLELNEVISFAGNCSTEILKELYCGAAAVVVPSRIEGFGLVALEAMACGAPVVCSPTPSLREVCDDAAWISAGFSAREYATTVRSALENEIERTRKVQRGLQRATLFDRRIAGRRTLDVYQNVLRELPVPSQSATTETRVKRAS